MDARATYFLGVYERASGWKLLGFGQTETVMWLSVCLLVLSPLSWVFVEVFGLFYSNITMDAVYLVPPALWRFYTAVESHNAGELKKKRFEPETRKNLRFVRNPDSCRCARFCTFSGTRSPAFYILPFNSVVFASPLFYPFLRHVH